MSTHYSIAEKINVTRKTIYGYDYQAEAYTIFGRK
jgi:hypothetical protein